MLKNTKIGLRLTSGFVLVLAIFVLATIFSWNNLRLIETDTGHLAGERFREIQITADIEKSILKATGRYGEYALGGDKTSLEEGAMALESAGSQIEEAQSLAEINEEMAELATGSAAAAETLQIFRNAAASAETTLIEIGGHRDEAAAALTAYLDNVDSYLKGERTELESEIEFEMGAEAILDRTKKITIGNRLIERILGMDREVYRGQALRDSHIVTEALYGLADVRSDLAKLRSLTYVKASKKKLDQVKAALRDYEGAVEDMVACWEEMDMLLMDLDDASRSAQEAAAAVNSEAFKKVDGLADRIVGNLSGTVKIMLGVTLAAILIGLAISMVITRSILTPLKSVVSMARLGGEGDLTLHRADFSLDLSDEVGEMAEALEKMLVNQKEVVEAIKREASETMSGSRGLVALSGSSSRSAEEIREALKELSDLSETNAAALEETNASIEEVSSGAKNSAQSSGEAARISNETRNIGEEATRHVEKVIDEVRETACSTEANATTVQRLVVSVEKIAGFVTTISGIADQTNLLALNAAIEAARAGDAGRGFAVVADEVRKLAENSNGAAKEIEGLIGKLRSEAKESVQAIHASVENMQGTASRAEGARKSLMEALERIREIDGVVQNLASLSQEQAAVSVDMANAVEQVTTGNSTVVEKIVEIGHSSETTAEASGKVEEEARNLAEAASRMEGLLERFVIDDPEGKIPAPDGEGPETGKPSESGSPTDTEAEETA